MCVSYIVCLCQALFCVFTSPSPHTAYMGYRVPEICRCVPEYTVLLPGKTALLHISYLVGIWKPSRALFKQSLKGFIIRKISAAFAINVSVLYNSSSCIGYSRYQLLYFRYSAWGCSLSYPAGTFFNAVPWTAKCFSNSGACTIFSHSSPFRAI